ncbi:MAG: hypothetical protein DLM58_12725 [Pseudonocardiales bacterium]|nr:MAG: hypothetical protein DLM58_12725 [Pseudonocardiales bacterium]
MCAFRDDHDQQCVRASRPFNGVAEGSRCGTALAAFRSVAVAALGPSSRGSGSLFWVGAAGCSTEL